MTGALKLLTVLVFPALVIGCQGGGNFSNILDSKDAQNVIYGDDDRRDLYQVKDERLLNLADSTVALVKASHITPGTQGMVRLKERHFGDTYGLCQSEPYREQTASAFCSGSLIAPDVVLTAGHCIPSDYRCESTKLVFGYGIHKRGQNPSSIPRSEVYGCKEIIHTEQSPVGADFALIRLDRKVTNHEPLAIREEGSISRGEALTIIGHPSGLPAKIAGGAKVRKLRKHYFVATLDSYGGNSGSAVFNTETGLIEGILVRGEDDFVYQESGCQVSKRCDEDKCRGEDVTNISEIWNYLENSSGKTEGFESKTSVAIPDGNQDGISSPIDVLTTPKGRKVYVEVDIEHPWSGDLILTVVTPENESVVLSYLEGSNGPNIKGTFGINLQSRQDMSKLSDVSTVGQWKLHISDRVERDQGILRGWKILFSD